MIFIESDEGVPFSAGNLTQSTLHRRILAELKCRWRLCTFRRGELVVNVVTGALEKFGSGCFCGAPTGLWGVMSIRSLGPMGRWGRWLCSHPPLCELELLNRADESCCCWMCTNDDSSLRLLHASAVLLAPSISISPNISLYLYLSP